MDKIFTNAAAAFASLYSKESPVSSDNRSAAARKKLIIIDAYFESNPPDFNTLLFFVERATSTHNRTNMLKPYIFRLAELASSTEEMFTAWKFFVGGSGWNSELKILLQRIIESDPSVETYARVTELLLARI